jgi:hypothetical protein
MNMLKTLTVLAFGSMLVIGCGGRQDEPATETDTPSAAVETPAPPPGDEVAPVDATGTMPSEEPDPAMSDTLPTAEEPPPMEPSPPND